MDRKESVMGKKEGIFYQNEMIFENKDGQREKGIGGVWVFPLFTFARISKYYHNVYIINWVDGLANKQIAG